MMDTSKKLEALHAIIDTGVVTPTDLLARRNEATPENRRQLDRLAERQHDLAAAARAFLSAFKDSGWEL